jgi:hypothetical protein
MKLSRFFSARAVLAITASALFILGGTTIGTPPAHAAKAAAVCSLELKHRTPEQAIQEHIALLQAGMIDEAMCDYADEATVVLPGQVIVGKANIRTGLEQIASLLGVGPTVTSFTPTDRLVMITFDALGSPCQIRNGSDTYIVEKGLIVAQTVHDTFTSAPGFTCPLAAPGS